MDGALAGQIKARDFIIKTSLKVGDVETADLERKRDGGKIVIEKAAARRMLGWAMGEGNEWAGDIEKRIRRVLRNALITRTAGTEIPQNEIALQIRATILQELAPEDRVAAFEADALFAARPKVKMVKGRKTKRVIVENLQKHQTKQIKSRWSKLEKQRAAKKQKKKLSRQAAARFKKGWATYQNTQAVARVQDNPEVVLMQFTLNVRGTSQEHTDICAERQGWTTTKGSSVIATNLPPLHYGCNSAWVPVTRAVAKKYKIKRWTPPHHKDEPPADGFGSYRPPKVVR